MSTSQETADLRQRKKNIHPAPSSSTTTTTTTGRGKTLRNSDPSSSSSSEYNRPILKLGIVSISLAVLPIATYFGTLGRVFEETNTTGAAISAIVVTNVILVGYILVAVFEAETEEDPSRSTPATTTTTKEDDNDKVDKKRF